MKSGCLARPIALALICVGSAHAQSAPDEIVVTGARTAPLADVGGVALDRAAIEALAPPTARDALDRIAGVRAFSVGGIAGGSFVSVRGGKPGYTLVLIDGAKVNDPTNSAGGVFDFGQIDPALIERIELYRGALSAVHGADALSGVIGIQLRTPRADENSVSGEFTGSSGGEVGGNASAALGWSGGGLLLGGGAYDSGDLDPGGRLARRQGLARLVTRAGGVKLSALGLYANTARRVYPEDSGGPRLAVNRARARRDTDFALTALEATAADAHALVPTLRASWSRQTFDDDTPATPTGKLFGPPAIRANSAFDRFEAGFDLRYTHGALKIAAGADGRDELGVTAGTVDFGVLVPVGYRLRRNQIGGFVEATLAPASGRASLTASVRHDAPSDARARWTARIAGSVTPVAGGPRLFASYSEGFKLPSIYALAYPLVANPLLKPERAESIEAGLDWRGHAASARVAAFSTRYRDYIDFDSVRFTTVNRDHVDTRGVEAEGTATIARGVRAEGAIAYLFTNNPYGPPLRTRPDVHGSARVTWTPTTKFALFADADAVSNYFDASIPTGQIRVRGHSEYALGGGYAIARGVRVDMALRNLTDRHYEDAVGFPNPGRVVRMTLRLTR